MIAAWAEEGSAPRAARWVVFRDERLRRSLAAAHAALAAEPPGLAVDEAVLGAVDALRPHLAPGPGPRRTRPEHAAVRRARRYLEERWAEPVALAELAAVAGLSRFELARTFRAQVGLPPHAFQLDLRVARARALLAAGEPPAAVAAACGFFDQAHLQRAVFRRGGRRAAGARYAARSSKTLGAARPSSWRRMAVTDFDTKVAVVVRDDLAAWQRLNVCAFLMSGVVGGAGERVVGPGLRGRLRAGVPADAAPARARVRVLGREAADGLRAGGRARAALRRSSRRTSSRRGTTTTTARPCGRCRARRSTSSGSRVRAPHKAVDGVVRGLKRHP